MTEDKGFVKDINGHYYVLKDHSLPEDNYYTSDFYQMQDPYQKKMQRIYVSPGIIVFLNEGFQANRKNVLDFAEETVLDEK